MFKKMLQPKIMHLHKSNCINVCESWCERLSICPLNHRNASKLGSCADEDFHVNNNLFMYLVLKQQT